MKQISFYLLFALSFLLLGGCCITRPDCNPDGGNFVYGPEFSLRSAGFWGDDVPDEEKHIGTPGFGAFLHWNYCDEFPEGGIRSGLYFNQFGGKRKFEGDGFEYTYKKG